MRAAAPDGALPRPRSPSRSDCPHCPPRKHRRQASASARGDRGAVARASKRRRARKRPRSRVRSCSCCRSPRATFGRAAEAVQAGFLAAAAAAKEKVVVIAHGDGEVLAAFDKAKAAGARVIVGPLVRDDVKALAAAAADLPPILALNQLDEGASLPRNVYVAHAHDRQRGAPARAARKGRRRDDRRGHRERHAAAAALRQRVQRRMDTGGRRARR